MQWPPASDLPLMVHWQSFDGRCSSWSWFWCPLLPPFIRCQQAGAEIYSVCSNPRQASNVSKFPCFLNMPPINLERSASFFGLFLPSVCKAEEIRGTPEIANPSTWPWAQHRTVRKWRLKGGMEGRSRGREGRGSKVTGHQDLALRPVRLHHLGANLPPLLDFELKNKDHNLESSLYFSSQNA